MSYQELYIVSILELIRGEVGFQDDKLLLPVGMLKDKIPLEMIKKAREAFRSEPPRAENEEVLAEKLMKIFNLGEDDLEDKIQKDERCKGATTDKEKLMRVARSLAGTQNQRERERFDYRLSGGDAAMFYLVARRGPPGIDIEELLTEFCVMHYIPESKIPGCKKSNSPTLDLLASLKKDPWKYSVSGNRVISAYLSPPTAPPDELYYKDSEVIGLEGFMHFKSVGAKDYKPVDAKLMEKLGYKVMRVDTDHYVVKAPGMLCNGVHPGLSKAPDQADVAILHRHAEVVKRGIPVREEYPTWLVNVINTINEGRVVRGTALGAAVVGFALRRLMPSMMLEEDRLKVVERVTECEVPAAVWEALGLPVDRHIGRNLMKLVFASLYNTSECDFHRQSTAEKLVARILGLQPFPYTSSGDEFVPMLAGTSEPTHTQNTQPQYIPEEKLDALYHSILCNAGSWEIEEYLPKTVVPLAFYIYVDKASPDSPLVAEPTFGDIEWKYDMQYGGSVPIALAIQKIVKTWGVNIPSRFYSMPHVVGRKIVFPDIPVTVAESARMIGFVQQHVATWVYNAAASSGLSMKSFRSKKVENILEKTKEVIKPIHVTTPVMFTAIGKDKQVTPPALVWNTIHHVSHEGDLLPINFSVELLKETSMRKFKAQDPSCAFSVPAAADPSRI